MPSPCRPLQFHRLQHGVESVKDFGTMFTYWCFRGENNGTTGKNDSPTLRCRSTPGRRSEEGINRTSSVWAAVPAAAESCLQEIITTFGQTELLGRTTGKTRLQTGSRQVS
eukprot:g33056.t1